MILMTLPNKATPICFQLSLKHFAQVLWYLVCGVAYWSSTTSFQILGSKLVIIRNLGENVYKSFSEEISLQAMIFTMRHAGVYLKDQSKFCVSIKWNCNVVGVSRVFIYSGSCDNWHFVLNHSAMFCWKLESFFLHKLYQNCSKSMFSSALATFKQKSNLISLLPIWYLAVKESVNIIAVLNCKFYI